MENTIRFLSIEEVIMINHLTIKTSSPKEMIGVRSQDLLESAINRPKQSVFGEDAYKTIFDKAAALLESLAQNHAFLNGNKRTAFLSMLQFIKYNNYRLTLTNEEATKLTLDIIFKKINLKEISEIIKKNSAPII